MQTLKSTRINTYTYMLRPTAFTKLIEIAHIPKCRLKTIKLLDESRGEKSKSLFSNKVLNRITNAESD